MPVWAEAFIMHQQELRNRTAMSSHSQYWATAGCEIKLKELDRGGMFWRKKIELPKDSEYVCVCVCKKNILGGDISYSLNKTSNNLGSAMSKSRSCVWESFCRCVRGIRLHITDRPSHLKGNTSLQEESTLPLHRNDVRERDFWNCYVAHKLDFEIPCFLCY